MPLLEIVLWIVAVVAFVFFLLLAIAGVFAFIGAMSMPEDMHDDVLGDKYEKHR